MNHPHNVSDEEARLLGFANAAHLRELYRELAEAGAVRVEIDLLTGCEVFSLTPTGKAVLDDLDNSKPAH